MSLNPEFSLVVSCSLIYYILGSYNTVAVFMLVNFDKAFLTPNDDPCS